MGEKSWFLNYFTQKKQKGQVSETWAVIAQGKTFLKNEKKKNEDSLRWVLIKIGLSCSLNLSFLLTWGNKVAHFKSSTQQKKAKMQGRFF